MLNKQQDKLKQLRNKNNCYKFKVNKNNNYHKQKLNNWKELTMLNKLKLQQNKFKFSKEKHNNRMLKLMKRNKCSNHNSYQKKNIK